jgi:hypothetical protein
MSNPIAVIARIFTYPMSRLGNSQMYSRFCSNAGNRNETQTITASASQQHQRADRIINFEEPDHSAQTP